MHVREILSARIDDGWMAVIIIAALILGGGAILLTTFAIYSKREDIVQTHSKQIADIKKLNSKYYFFKFPNENIRKNCSSKKAFDRVYLEDVLKEDLGDNLEYYYDIIDKVKQNRNNYQRYINEYNHIVSTISKEEAKSLKISLATFQKIEKRICGSLQLKPQTDVSIHVAKSYSSPQGRNSYYDASTYNFSEWTYYYNLAVAEKNRKQTHAYKVQAERAKMSDSMRYDVMRRDNFRCVLCGAKASDGVQLHVDHIFPVSKGGKTEMSNLRTLCSRCNLGKGSKIE